MSLGEEDVQRKRTVSFKGNKLTPTALAMNMVLSIVGTTVLGIAAQMQLGGWILSPLLLCMGCAIVSETTGLVSETIGKLQEDGVDVVSYQDYIEGAVGPRARVLSSVTSTCALLGMICNGMVMIAKNLEYAVPIGDDVESGRKLWVLLMMPTTLFYLFVDATTILQRLALVGPVVAALCVLFAWIGTVQAIPNLADFPESCMNSKSQSYWNVGPNLDNDGSGGIGWFEFANGVSGIASYGFYCFAVVVTVPTLRSQMSDPTQTVKSSIAAYVICCILFITIMLLGYYVFGNLGPDSIINAMNTDRPSGWWATTSPWETGHGTTMGKIFSWMVTINLLMTDGIYVPVTAVAIEGWAPATFAHPRHGKIAKVAMRVLVASFRHLVAAVVTKFLLIIGITSSLFCICNNILLPIFAFHYARVRVVSPFRKAVHAMMFLFGIYCSVFGSIGPITVLVQDLTGSNLPSATGAAATSGIGAFPRAGISQECVTLYCSLPGQNSSDACQSLSLQARVAQEFWLV